MGHRMSPIKKAMSDLGVLIFIGIPLVPFMLIREITLAFIRLVLLVVLSVILRNRK